MPPGEYADRFFDFMKAIMTGGEGGERFIVGGGDHKEGQEGTKEGVTEMLEEEATGLCRCLGVCGCRSSGN